MGLFDYLEEKRREAAMKRNAKEAGKFLVGASVGTILGLLFAPQSGEETRKNIADKAKETADSVESATRDAADTIQIKAYQAGEQAKKTYAGLKDKLEDKKVQFEEDKEVAKAKAHAIGEIVKEGAEDVKSDLNKTKEDIKETSKEAKKDLEKGAKEVKEDVKDASEKIEKNK